MLTTPLAHPVPIPATPRREYLKCLADPVYFIARFCKVRHPLRGTIPFDLWPWQRDLVRRYQTTRQLIALKSRQIGVSEVTIAYALWLARFRPSKTILIISKGQKEADDLLTRLMFMYTHLPPWLQASPDAPDHARLGKANTSQIQIDHLDAAGRAHPSVIHSLPATRDTGRGYPASLVIMDEWAFQQWDANIWGGVKPTIDSGGQLIGISTANGLGNTFHSIWTGAVAGENSFTPIFLSWRRHPERDDTWYARQARDYQPWLLHQEYPGHPTEAFIQSGRPVFDATYLTAAAARSTTFPPPLRQSDGITIWAEPIPEQRDPQTNAVTARAHRYLIAADVAEGLADGDYDAAAVVDRDTGMQVAEIHGHWPFAEFAAKLDALGRYYHTATLAVERNNHGHSVLLALQSGLAGQTEDGQLRPYPALYHYQDPIVTAGAPPQSRPGWATTAQTKPLAIDHLAQGLREEAYLPRSQAFYDEALVYAYDDKGKMSAPPGYHDDLVMAHAIAAYLLLRPDPIAAQLDEMTRMLTKMDAAQDSHFPGGIPGTIRHVGAM